MTEENRMSVGQFAKKVGYCIRTIQRWDVAGILVAKRTITGRRYYTQEDVEVVLKSG